MFDVITIGSALVDIFIHSDNFITKDGQKNKLLCQLYGDKLDIDSFKLCTGGGGSNTAVGFSRLGLRTAIICETGQDNLSHLVLEELVQAQVETNYIIKEKREQTGGSVILVGEEGGRSVLVHRGASSMLDPYDISCYWLSQTSWIHLTSIGGRLPAFKKIMKFLSKERDIQLSWNPGKGEINFLIDRAYPIKKINCDILYVNESEWASLAPVQMELLKRINKVIVTKGKDGGEVYINSLKKYTFPGANVNSIDDTGAGDAFATGFTASQVYHLTVREGIKWGVANAGSVIRYFGAKTGLLHRESMDKL